VHHATAPPECESHLANVNTPDEWAAIRTAPRHDANRAD